MVFEKGPEIPEVGPGIYVGAPELELDRAGGANRLARPMKCVQLMTFDIQFQDVDALPLKRVAPIVFQPDRLNGLCLFKAEVQVAQVPLREASKPGPGNVRKKLGLSGGA